MERGFENGGVVRGLVGGLGGRCGGRVVEQDKGSTVSHCARSGFSAHFRTVHAQCGQCGSTYAVSRKFTSARHHSGSLHGCFEALSQSLF
jgi:hypothetical protein